jgi:hypothetical protein
VRNDVAMTTLTNHEPHFQTRQLQSDLIPEGATCLQLELADGLTRELTQVRISRSFAFGLLEDKSTWSLIQLSHVLALKFQRQDPEASPAVIWTRKSAGELLALLPLPAPANLWFQKEPHKKVGLVVLGVTRGLVATDSALLAFVPLQAISSLEISPR